MLKYFANLNNIIENVMVIFTSQILCKKKKNPLQKTITNILKYQYYHYLCDLLRIITIKVKFKGNHLPIVRFQLALCNSVSHIRDLQNIQSG